MIWNVSPIAKTGMISKEKDIKKPADAVYDLHFNSELNDALTEWENEKAGNWIQDESFERGAKTMASRTY